MFIFLATNRVRPGMLAAERHRVPGWVEFVEQNEPRLIAFHEFLSADGTEVEYVQIHPDAASFEHHLQVVAQTAESYRFTLAATTAIRIYGAPTERILTTLRKLVDPHVPVVVRPTYLGGFTRRGPAQSDRPRNG
jgi:hypothetical protein